MVSPAAMAEEAARYSLAAGPVDRAEASAEDLEAAVSAAREMALVAPLMVNLTRRRLPRRHKPVRMPFRTW